MQARVLAVVLGCAGWLGAAASLQALCLGCPPVAWKATLQLDDGSEIESYLRLSAFLA